MVIIYFLNFIDYLNRKFYVNNSLQGKMKVVQFDEFDSRMLGIIR